MNIEREDIDVGSAKDKNDLVNCLEDTRRGSGGTRISRAGCKNTFVLCLARFSVNLESLLGGGGGGGGVRF